MGALIDSLPSPQAGSGLQSISILFNAATLAVGAMRPPFVVQIQRPDPNAALNATAAILDSLQIDATLNEIHSAQAEVTEHPVEQGSDISDHVRPKPVELKIEGVVSDTPLDSALLGIATRSLPPLGLAAQAASSITNLLAKSSFARGAFDTLRKLRDAGQPLTIFTPYRTYTSMVMTDLQVIRDTQGGEGMHFTAAFKQVLTVQSATVQVQLPQSAQGPLDMGTQSTTPAPGKVTKNISVLYQGFNGGTSNGPLDAFKAWTGQ